ALLELKLGCTYPGQFPARQVAAPPENHRDSLTRFEQRPTRQHPRPLLRPKLVRYVLKSSNAVIVGSYCQRVRSAKLDAAMDARLPMIRRFLTSSLVGVKIFQRRIKFQRLWCLLMQQCLRLTRQWRKILNNYVNYLLLVLKNWYSI